MSTHANVLVVEDDLDTANFMVAVLKGAGFGVRQTSTRDAAMFAVTLYLYDFILLDISMPGMTIDEFMKRSSDFRSAEVVLMSAYPILANEAERLGVKFTLKKPFDREDLLELLASISPDKISRRRKDLPTASESQSRLKAEDEGEAVSG